MKSKSGRHKSTNTFKVLSFSERIQKIDIRRSALYFIGHENEHVPEENETHFASALIKWQHLNSTIKFREFRTAVSHVHTIEQLVHKKDHIINTVIKYLEDADATSVQPILEIIVSIAKDLGNEFYPSFKECFRALLKLLDTKDGDQLEWTFICLAFLLKVLRSQIKKDLPFIINHLLPLLHDDQKQYITNFVAETFAFVVRDISHKKQFVLLLLNYIKDKDIGTTGSGHLMFEIIRGVNGQFHSCAQSYLSIMLQLFSELDEPMCQILFDVLTQTITDILHCVEPKFSDIFWIEIIKCTESIMNGDSTQNNDYALEFVLQLIGEALEYHEGIFLLDQQALVILIRTLLSKKLSPKSQEVCSNIIIIFIQSPRFRISQENSSSMVSAVLNMKKLSLLNNFVFNMINYQQFDSLVLVKYLRYIESLPIQMSVMQTLAKICIEKSPPSYNGIELYNWAKYPIRVSKDFHMKIQNVLEEVDMNKILIEPELYICILIILPHLPSYNCDDPVPILKNMFARLIECVEKNTSEKNPDTIRKALFILTTCIESYLHITDLDNSESIIDINTIMNVLLPYAGDCNYLGALQLLDLYLSSYKSDKLNMNILLRLDTNLRNNLSSPYHKIRLLTTHIYSLFEEIPELKKTTPFKGFTTCFTVESAKPSLAKYREQLMELRKIGRNTEEYEIIKDTVLNTNLLRYMFGALYFNFNLLWEPTIDIIIEYFTSQGKMWKLIEEILITTDKYVKQNPYTANFTIINGFETGTIEKMFFDFSTVTEVPNFDNYRILLWQLLSRVPALCETNNESFTEIFFRFVEKEYRKGDIQNYLTKNLKEYESSASSDIEDEELLDNVENEELLDNVEDKELLEDEEPLDEVEDEELLDQIEDSKGEETINNLEDESEEIPLDNVEEEKDEEFLDDTEGETETSGKLVFRTLLIMIEIYSKFKKPKKCHRSTELYNLYMDLLKHKNDTMQTNALNCILTYNEENLFPYKRELLDLTNDRKMRATLVSFPISKDSSALKSHDREAVLPVVLRILYGKMLSNTDKKTGQARRCFIMRHISGCFESEIETFTMMAFKVFQKYMNLDAKTIFETIMSNTNLESVLSPNVLRSSINFAEVMRKHMGGYMGSALPLLHKVLYSVSSITHGVLSRPLELHSGFKKILKTIRALCITFINKLFEQFDKYEWTEGDLYTIFETMIWPSLPKLHIDGVQSPTALLKVFITWSQNPKYYVLLATHHPDDVELSPLPCIYKLLAMSQINGSVVNSILEITENLLTLQEAEEDLLKPLQSFAVLPNAPVHKSAQNVNYGSRILIPHIQIIIEFIKKRVAKCSKKKDIPKRDVLILSRLTELVTDKKLCEDLLGVLLPILVKNTCLKTDQQNIEYAIITISNLISKSMDTSRYILTIAPLFNKIAIPTIRKQLCKLLHTIAQKSSSDIELATIMSGLNAFDVKWIDQPDLDARFRTYDTILQKYESDDISLNFAVTVVNNIFFSLRHDKDISSRHSAIHCLRKVLPKWLRHFKTQKGESSRIINDTVLKLISSGIKDNKNEILKTECLTLLGDLARSCPNVDFVLTDLSHLTNDADRELDFFDNIVHLQMHKRVDALKAFCTIAKTLPKALSVRTLTEFVLPLATCYLCADDFADQMYLIDAAMDVVSVSSRLLPWSHYEAVLKFYLNKLRNSREHHKMFGRIFIKVLGSFHFDLKDVQLPTADNLTEIRKLPAAVEKTNRKLIKEIEKKEKPLSTNKFFDENSDDDEPEPELMEAVEEIINVEEQPAYSKITKPSDVESKRIVHYVTRVLIPHFNRIVTKKTEDDLKNLSLQAPLTMAIVRILHEMPTEVFDQRFPSIIASTCTLLKSRVQRVRDSTRSTIVHIMLQVGPNYLRMVLEQLKTLLTKGFLVHVLVSTVCKLLEGFLPVLKIGEIDASVPIVMELCIDDIFGELSEEKQVEKLGQKTDEAKFNNKTVRALNILAQRVSDENLTNVVLPIKNILLKGHSKKVTVRVQQVLEAIANGFADNQFVSIEKLYDVLYGIALRDLPELNIKATNVEGQKKPVSKYLEERTECLIIQQAPNRIKEAQTRNVKKSSEVNYHILQEFSFNLFHVLIKRKKSPKDFTSMPLFDVFVGAMAEAIRENKITLATAALKGLTSIWELQVLTPHLMKNIAKITAVIFEKMHQNATFGMTKRKENLEYVKNLFKAATAIVCHVKYYRITKEQLNTLLLYAEQDLESDDRHITAFNLLKAILRAKLNSPELSGTMFLIAKIAIQSESQKICTEARTTFMNYLMHYEIGKKTEKHLQFFATQLNYECDSGRISAIQFLTLVIKRFKVSRLEKYSGFLFLSLGARLVNEPSRDVRELVSECAETLIEKLTDREVLFELVATLLRDTKVSHIEMAALLTSRFIMVEKGSFINRLRKILPIMLPKLTSLSGIEESGRFVRVNRLVAEPETTGSQQDKDQCTVELLQTFENLVENCPLFLKNEAYREDLDILGQNCHLLLQHDHMQVRTKAVKILAAILKTISIKDLKLGMIGDTERGFIYNDPENSLKTLTHDLGAQMSTEVTQDLAEQVTSAIHQIFNIVIQIPTFEGFENNIVWIMKAIRGLINIEVAHAPFRTVIRLSIFKMMLEVISSLDLVNIEILMPTFIISLIREVTSTEARLTEVRNVGSEIGKKIRSKLGGVKYYKMVASAESKLNLKRAVRKKEHEDDKMNNPERALKRKERDRERKKDIKRRKIDKIKGRPNVAVKRKHIDDEYDD